MILQRASNRRSAKPSGKACARKISSRKEPAWFQRSKWARRSGQTWIADLSRSQEVKNSRMMRCGTRREIVSFFLDSRILDFLAPELLAPVLRQVGHSRQHRSRRGIGEVENSRGVKRQMMADGQLGDAVDDRPRE